MIGDSHKNQNISVEVDKMKTAKYQQLVLLPAF